MMWINGLKIHTARARALMLSSFYHRRIGCIRGSFCYFSAFDLGLMSAIPQNTHEHLFLGHGVYFVKTSRPLPET
jgi:hypothetical protein